MPSLHNVTVLFYVLGLFHSEVLIAACQLCGELVGSVLYPFHLFSSMLHISSPPAGEAVPLVAIWLGGPQHRLACTNDAFLIYCA